MDTPPGRHKSGLVIFGWRGRFFAFRARTLRLVTDLPPDLPRLHAVRQYLLHQLARVEAAIHAAETGGEPWLSGPAPGWRVVALPTGAGRPRRLVVHRTDCWAAKGGSEATREQAVETLRAPGGEACKVCHPETELVGG